MLCLDIRFWNQKVFVSPCMSRVTALCRLWVGVREEWNKMSSVSPSFKLLRLVHLALCNYFRNIDVVFVCIDILAYRKVLLPPLLPPPSPSPLLFIFSYSTTRTPILGGAVAQSVERATPGEEVLDKDSIPAVATRSLLVGSNRCLYVTGWDRSHGLPVLSRVWQHLKLSCDPSTI